MYFCAYLGDLTFNISEAIEETPDAEGIHVQQWTIRIPQPTIVFFKALFFNPASYKNLHSGSFPLLVYPTSQPLFGNFLLFARSLKRQGGAFT